MKKIIIGIALAGAINVSTVEAKYENVSDLSKLDIEEINQEDDLNSLKQLNNRTSALLKTISNEEKLGLFGKKNNPRYRKATEVQTAIKTRIKVLEKEQKAQAATLKKETMELNKIQNYTGGATLTKQFTTLSNTFSKTANSCKTLALNINTFNSDNNIDSIIFISNELFPACSNCYQIAATTNEHIVKATTAQSKSKARGDRSETDARRLWGISNELYEALSQNLKIFSSVFKALHELSYENLNNEGNIIQLLNKTQNQIQGLPDLREQIEKLKQIKSSDRQSQNCIDRIQENLIPIYNMLNEIRIEILPVIIDLIQNNDKDSLKQIINKIEDILSNDEFNNNTRRNSDDLSYRSNNSYYDNSSLNRNNRNSSLNRSKSSNNLMSYSDSSLNRNNRNSSLNRSKSSNNISSMSDNFNRETMRRSKNRTTLFSQQGYDED